LACVADAPGPSATLFAPVATLLLPKAAPPLAAEAAEPSAIDPVATAPVPMAMELIPVLWLFRPMATAPDLEAISALTPYDQGGNMDVPDTKPGNTLYLPVRVPGAYFFTGDCHAGQGDGELCGVALEITAKAMLTFDLIKQKRLDWPRIESPDAYMAVGSARPMEDAARIAYAELITWMVEMGWDRWEAYQALTQIGGLYVGNMVDTTYSLVASIAKEYVRHNS